MQNQNKISLTFDFNCLPRSSVDLLTLYHFHEFDEIFRGYIELNLIASLFLQLRDFYIFNHCLLEIDFENFVQIQEIQCNFETTNEIYYNSVLKPSAWHLDLLNNLSDNSYNFPTSNPNVTVWVLDTGVFWKHKEFEYSEVVDVDPLYNLSKINHAHGTGVAAMMAGFNYGSSKKFKIYNYPVCRFGGSCGSSDIEKGFLEVLKFCKASYPKRTVINLSFGTSFGGDVLNSTLGRYYNGIFKEITQYGGIVVTSAGNGNQDACTWLYSYSPYVISVGSVDQSFKPAPSSNWGSCVDIYSFGASVPTAYSYVDPNVIQYKSGTSFASPLVAGVVANLLAENITLSRSDILGILYTRYKNITLAVFNCGDLREQCCQSIPHTRLDKYCRTFSVTECDRRCKIAKC